MDRVVGAGYELLDHLGAKAESVAVASAVSPGVVFEDRGQLAPNNTGWETLGLGRELRSAFGARVPDGSRLARRAQRPAYAGPGVATALAGAPAREPHLMYRPHFLHRTVQIS